MANKNVNVATKSENEVNILNMDNVTSKLSEVLTVNTDSFFTTLENGTEISQKVYQLVNPVGKKETITVYDATIIESIEKISVSMKAKDLFSYVICKELANIQNTGKLENMGFKNIAEFAKAVYGFESSTANHYAKIGNSFINSDYSVKSGLPKLSISHFIELNSLVGENGEIDGIIELFMNGTLIDGMSTKKFREVVKTLKNGNIIEDKSNNSDNSANSAENANNNASVQPEVINLEKSFDIKVAVAQVIGHCNELDRIFAIIEKNGHDVKQYYDVVDAIATKIKTLL